MKKELTSTEIYKKNTKRAKILKLCSPIVFWSCIALSVILLVVALKNSFGNIAEIIHLLDDKKYTGDQLSENYAFLIDKYGEWLIGNGSNGFTIKFINIGKALFSGVAVISLFFSVLFLVGAFLVGKWLLPMLSQSITQQNQDNVNLTTLEMADKMKEKDN